MTSSLLFFDAKQGGPCLFLVQPRIARGVLSGIVRVEIDEAALDLPVADLEHVAPAAGTVLGHAGAPRPVAMLALAGALAAHHIAAGKDIVEMRVVMQDRLQRAADVAEHLPDLLLAGGDAPFREIDLGVVGEEVENAAAVPGLAGTVERLEIVDDHRLSLLVSHGLLGESHQYPPVKIARAAAG